MEGFIFNFIDFVEGLFIPKKWHSLGQFVMFWVSVVLFIFTVIVFGSTILEQPVVRNGIWILAVTMPIWLPIALFRVFFIYYMRYVRAYWIKKEGSVLLEIKIPKETNRSPLAMEIFFTALYQTGSATVVQAFWEGKVRPWFSFELVSLGGEVHIFIWSLRKWRNMIEAQLYAQYPTLEIHEVADYTDSVYHDPENLPLWATYFIKEKESVYPIKTYVDYGLDKLDIKEEYKIDPITATLEYLGSLRKGEQAWIQIMIMAHRGEKLIDGRFFNKKSDWKKEIDEEVEKIREESMVEEEVGEGIVRRVPHSTPGQVESIKSLERSKEKFPFETAIRGFYIAKKEAFNPISVTGLIGSFRQYNSNTSNGFRLGWYTDPDLPWRDYKRKRRNHMEIEMLEAYKLRSFFQYPFKNFESEPCILTTEELATIFHFPGSVSATPTLERVSSKKAEPPSNLPR
ncbi:MAG: hypothetical protein A3H57_03225 [Candidatus Taylorbacteria bacterium RIFCSPLOWO2_02_FULL_43_11]|uniref:DUF8128 domain-containing protein n=1 Tax=Candidatus Taylorbacteria bacterium RIFCSPHIGHO2_02_FULL_43_32b TaxID=1802306 RepID=A0A1G2MI52_9BACT|nr:MAG: hypothetical protein A2743_00855 [Candidatus Taylorbacteria bacterium RIFCSPHIGHO2_01_FULL_43_47]OHA22672.1 MAG: hypothetical protein A3C72_01280 [Candidatus Taylorbacteria bacterium RIFCSPHIGHO2_02_FULL_43_32b]OHA29632.1 MAG: hypothetical protein A3B08_03385 [Candidatus Taylorbacteria bacterium RIFCSPLOWO2_01_FULL_43_44]OHA36117.1 MAG: hypothetical protein A3H57_03225 [Candidatus Taylorbacteria bacterium RIFCSPLOWO2_02_FULL_43_11]